MTDKKSKRYRGAEVFGDVVLAVHGGAGALTRAAISAEREQEYLQHLESALRSGFVLLKRGKRSLDAVEAAVRYLEDCPLFNAGRGSVFTADGTFELDAAIMDGRTRRAGAVAAVSIVRNPISAARAVMQDTKHVMLAGAGAELVAAEAGVEIVNPSYFFTEQRRKQWEQLGHGHACKGDACIAPTDGCADNAGHGCADNAGHACADNSGHGCADNAGHGCADNAGHACADNSGHACADNAGHGCADNAGHGCADNSGHGCRGDAMHRPGVDERKHGTVGAVARDRRGNLAAATSTGGTMGKRAGRIGDSPIIGAGTYAENATCAVSTTGHGESFMRTVAAYDVSALMKYRRMGLKRAATEVVRVSLDSVKGQGGLIAIDAAGNCALPFNTSGMLRGCITANGEVYSGIYRVYA